MKYCKYCMNEIEVGNTMCQKCGKNLLKEEPMHHLQPGTILAEKYLVGAALGEGGFGITYLGLNTRLDLKVAIKEFFPFGYVHRVATMSSTVTDRTEAADDDFFEKGRERFLAEAKILAKFNSEVGIVSVHDFFEENNTAYIVMEYLEGQTLKSYLAKKGRLSYDDTISLLMPAMRSLDKIHEKGLIHRDISPDNIMLTGDKVKLLDFGAARYADGGNKSLSVMLKHGYAPEEQYRRKGEQGPWTDVYALSATIYKCITGATPDDASERAYKDELKAPSEYGIKIDPVCEAALMKGMSVYSNNRYKTVKELINGLLGKDDTLVIPSAAISSLNIDSEKTVYGGNTTDTEKTVFGIDTDKTVFTAEPIYHEKKEEVPEYKKDKHDKPKEKRSKKMMLIALVAILVVASVIGSVIAISLNKGKEPLPLMDDTEMTIENIYGHTHENEFSLNTQEQIPETKTSSETTNFNIETETENTQSEQVTTETSGFEDTTTEAESAKTTVTAASPDNVHTHTYSTWIIKKQPDCTTTGIEERICSECGEKEIRSIAAKGHTLVTDKAVAATCTIAGKTDGSHCIICGFIEKEQLEISAKGHRYGEWITTKPATDTSEGLETKTCSVCGDKIIRSIDLINHNYVAVVTLPTCMEQGYTSYVCSDCGKEYKDDFKPSLGHNYNPYYQTKSPTCTNTGLEEHSCSRCGNKETRTVAQKEHIVVTDNAVAATCTFSGKTEGSHCEVCGTVIKAQTTIAAKGHTVVIDNAIAATCTSSGKTDGSHCEVCGTVIKAQTTVAAKGHAVVIDNAIAATCTEVGKTKGSHCSVCGVIIEAQATIAAKGHNIVTDNAIAATCTATGKTEGSHCIVCGAVTKKQTTVAALGHNYGEYVQTNAPTCTTPGTEEHVCTRCNNKESRSISATGHHYVNDICSKCGKRNYKVGDILTFGKYEQDNNTSNGKEDIEWLVLDKNDNKILVISKYILDFHVFNTDPHQQRVWSVENGIRKWLNNTFINSAFSNIEQNSIIVTTVVPDKNPQASWPEYHADTTTTYDKIFLLSIAEAEKYFSSNASRMCTATDYASAAGAYTTKEYYIDGKPTYIWWLRTPGAKGGIDHSTISYDGSIGYNGSSQCVNHGRGVRPAMWIDLGE